MAITVIRNTEVNRMKRTILCYLLFSLAMPAHSDTAVISFAAPTVYTDGASIPAGTAISYGVYQEVKGDPLPKVKVATITQTTTTITTGLVGGTEYCFHVTAIVAGQESVPSNEACKLMALPIPGAVTITVR